MRGFITLVLCLALVSFVTCKTCVANRLNNPTQTWTFDEDRYQQNLTTPPITFEIGQTITHVSVVYQFCEFIQLMQGDPALDPDYKTWLGWSFGVLSEFEYIRQEPLSPTGSRVPTPKALPELKEESENKERGVEEETQALAPEDVGSARTFVQTFLNGDYGYPCRKTGRLSYVHIYCADGPTANCLSTGATQPQCLSNGTNPTAQPCICKIDYPAYGQEGPNPCRLDIYVLEHDCPSMDHAALNPTPPMAPQGGPSGGEVFGIILLVLFLIALAVFIGGYVYNYKMNGKRGVDAIPFIDLCRKDESAGYQPAAQTSSGGYGTSN